MHTDNAHSNPVMQVRLTADLLSRGKKKKKVIHFWPDLLPVVAYCRDKYLAASRMHSEEYLLCNSTESSNCMMVMLFSEYSQSVKP